MALSLLLGCAVPELDATGAIVCGTNSLCPTGFRCELGRCCPSDAGVSCPVLARACVGSATANFVEGSPPSTCVADANRLYAECSARGGSNECGGFSCNARLVSPTMGRCLVPSSAQIGCPSASAIGNSCWEGRGVCVGTVQLGFDPMSVFDRSVVCVPTCSFPQGHSQAQCGAGAVCARLSGLTSPVCSPDCRVHGCGSSSTCDRATGSCRQ